MSDTDLSKIVGIIMENPKLIEEIKSLASKAESAENEVTTVEETSDTSNTETAAQVPEVPQNVSRTRRRELLSALKPYVSEGRGKALDSVMSIVDIIDMMRSN